MIHPQVDNAVDSPPHRRESAPPFSQEPPSPSSHGNSDTDDGDQQQGDTSEYPASFDLDPGDLVFSRAAELLDVEENTPHDVERLLHYIEQDVNTESYLPVDQDRVRVKLHEGSLCYYIGYGSRGLPIIAVYFTPPKFTQPPVKDTFQFGKALFRKICHIQNSVGWGDHVPDKLEYFKSKKCRIISFQLELTDQFSEIRYQQGTSSRRI